MTHRAAPSLGPNNSVPQHTPQQQIKAAIDVEHSGRLPAAPHPHSAARAENPSPIPAPHHHLADVTAGCSGLLADNPQSAASSQMTNSPASAPASGPANQHDASSENNPTRLREFEALLIGDSTTKHVARERFMHPNRPQLQRASMSIPAPTTPHPNHDVSNDAIKAGFPVIQEALVHLFNDVLYSQVFPAPWNEGLNHTHPQKGDKLNTDNYRGIIISSCIDKLFLKVMTSRIESQMDRLHRWCVNQCLLKRIVELKIIFLTRPAANVAVNKIDI